MLSMKQVNQFLLTCGAADDLYQFVKAVLDGVRVFCRYDQATAYLFNGNAKIVDRYLVNFDSKQSDVYLKYYFETTLGRNYGHVNSKVWTTAWDHAIADDFTTDYIQTRGIKRSAYFRLTDSNIMLRTFFAMDRIQDIPFSPDELEVLRFVVPHLNNLHRKLFLPPKDKADRKRALMEMAGLTVRETEIALLLCNGVSPTNISNTLHIAPATTHKHITHIYEKLHVSNLQELLVYLLNSEVRPSDLDRRGP